MLRLFSELSWQGIAWHHAELEKVHNGFGRDGVVATRKYKQAFTFSYSTNEAF